MGLFGRLKGLFSGDAPATQSAGGLLAHLTGTNAPRRGTRELLQAYSRLPYLHAIARRVADDVAAIPFEVYATKGKRAKSLAKSLASASGDVRATMEKAAKQAGELVPVDGHPFLDVLASMNPALGGHDSWFVSSLHMDLVGQSPFVIESNRLGQPVELWPVPPHWIAEMPRPGFPFYRASYGAWQRQFPEEAVLWMRVPDPVDPYGRGTGLGVALGDEFDVDELRARYAKNFFHNHAIPDAIISVEGATIDDAKRIRQEFENKHRGPNRVGVPHFTGGKTSVVQLQQTWQEMQLSEQRADGRRIVQEVWGFPPELLGVLDNSNRSTIDNAWYLYAKGILVPRKSRVVAALQSLLSRYDERLVLGFHNPVPEDEQAHRAHMVSVPSAFKVNEHRKAGGQAPLEGEEGEALFAPAAAPSPFGSLGLSADPPWTKALRPVNKSEDAMRRALEALRPERLTEEVGPVQDEEFTRWAQAVLDELGTGLRFDMRNPLVREVLEKAGEKIRGVTETTAEQLRSELQEGVFAGEGIRELANRVGDVFDHAEGYRSERIARTEVVGLSNAANLSAYVQSGVVDGKEWLSVRDGNTRESHRSLDGQRVDLSGQFVANNGRKTQHPGGFGIAEEDVQCRCSVLPVVAEKSGPLTEEQKAAKWKAYDRALVPWEERLMAAARRGFQKQRADVLRALTGG